MGPKHTILRQPYRRRQFSEESAYDVIICLDTSRSMLNVVNAIRESAGSMIDELFDNKIKNLKIGVSVL